MWADHTSFYEAVNHGVRDAIFEGSAATHRLSLLSRTSQTASLKSSRRNPLRHAQSWPWSVHTDRYAIHPLPTWSTQPTSSFLRPMNREGRSSSRTVLVTCQHPLAALVVRSEEHT